MTQQDDIDKALYGRRRGGRIRVAPKEERTADGWVFDSKHEMEVYLQFAACLRAGTFKKLHMQVPYPVFVTNPQLKPVKVFEWIADFVVTDYRDEVAVYDAKGFKTEIYRLKKKCVEAQYGFRIVEV